MPAAALNTGQPGHDYLWDSVTIIRTGVDLFARDSTGNAGNDGGGLSCRCGDDQQ